MNQDEKTLYYLGESRKWARAVLIESEKILDLSEKEISLHRSRTRITKEVLHDLRDRIQISEHYLVVALHQSIDWIEATSKLVSDLRIIYSEIKSSFPEFNDMRNMKEHQLEYIEGKGFFKERFNKTFNDGKYVADASSTIIDENGYYIGGRINVIQVNKHFIKVFEKINALYDHKFING